MGGKKFINRIIRNMRNLEEDNNGFVNFPIAGEGLKVGRGKSLVYIVAFSLDYDYILSGSYINLNSSFLTDDVSGRCVKIKGNYEEEGLSFISSDNDTKSFPMVSSVCIGWSDSSFINRDSGEYWYANFSSLSQEGKKLYYSIKKLHNNKEV